MNVEHAISLLKQLFASCENHPSWLDDGKFSVVLKTDIQFDVLRGLVTEEVFVTIDNPGISQSYLKGQKGAVTPGERIVVQLVNQVEKIVVVQSVVDLLAVSKAHQELPKAYIIWSQNADPDFYQSAHPERIPERAKGYHSAIQLWQFLKNHCHHQDSESDRLLFFGIRRVEISPGISSGDLINKVDISGALAFMQDEDRKEMRKDILVSRLSEHLKHHEASQCFSYLLSTFSVFVRGLREAMAIYLADHSPELLAEEAAKAAVEYTEKLEKIVSGLETKSLTIPAALLVAYTGVKSGSIGNNTVVIFTGLLYFAAMAWVWYTQSSLLDLLYKYPSNIAPWVCRSLQVS